MRKLWDWWNSISLVKQIIIGLLLGIVAGFTAPTELAGLGILGHLFVSALRAVAPILVLLLVSSALCQHRQDQKTNMKEIVILYLVGTFLAGVVAVLVSYIFVPTITLTNANTEVVPPSSVVDVVKNLVLTLVDNPVKAIMDGNYMGILLWATLLGVMLRQAQESTKAVLADMSDAVSSIVRLVIRFAPLGVMGLVFTAVVTAGVQGLANYAQLVVQLVGVMIVVALGLNPLIVYVVTRKNPYPLVFTCLRESGITAFFTRSSAANIPVNMALCEKLGLDKETYSVSIPLGATVNMAGAAVTISTLTLAAVHTLGINVDLPTAILLSVLAAISACGASGIAGGSLLLIPVSCSLFGISDEIAMQVVGAGFVIGVIQDSCETALNSSTDVLFTAAADIRRKQLDSQGSAENLEYCRDSL